MNGFVKYVAIGMGALALAACETTGQSSSGLIDQARSACSGASGFNGALCNGYVQLATEENNPYADYAVDHADAAYYANKAIAAGGGQTVDPTAISERALPADSIAEVTDGRNRLMAQFDAGARNSKPDTAARAQNMFDCWLEQLEEGYQPQDIARCRQGFLDALAELEYRAPVAAPTPAPAPGPAPAEPFLVFFDFDRSDITPEAARVIREAASKANASGAAAIQVIGHADRSGSASYNERLSMRRANAVKDELARNGISASSITVEGRGESDPLVPTADGVREPQNRRAEGIWIYR